MTEPELLQLVGRTHARYRGRRLSYFSGCDYFRLSSHPAVLKAAQRGLKTLGLNVAASRATTGNHPVYRSLELRLANFFDAPAALLLPTGYVAAAAAAQALAGNFSHAIVDEQAHPALLDAITLLDCPQLRFKHCDALDFARTVARCGAGARPIALTDGVFPADGLMAPLKAYLKALPADGLILVDDAHGAGVVGDTGKGTPEAQAVGRARIIQCVTLSKAFGCFGGAVIGSTALRSRIIERSRTFVGSTPIPLPLAAAALAAIKLLEGDARLRRRLLRNCSYVRTRLQEERFDVPQSPGPIIPFSVPDARIASLKRRLLAAGIYPPFIRYPGGPTNGYFRFVISSEHSKQQLDSLLKVLTGFRRLTTDH